jgi:uncharacterized NAD-dependent epimerase/dehydratase family protein
MPSERIPDGEPRRYAILAPGLFATRSAKTAHGVIAYGRDLTVAVIDPDAAGKRVRDVVPYLASDAPIVATLEEALLVRPTALLVGTAPPGGALPAAWRATIRQAIDAGLEIVSGLHQFLCDDAEFARAAARSGSTLRDVRKPPPPRLFSGEASEVGAIVVLTVGTDCAVGKMTASLELTRAARTAGRDARFLATGQTGILIAGSGVPADRTVSDFTSGAVEELVIANRSADLLFVEGQGAINHPAFAAVTLGLLYGAAPDALVLVHLAGRTHVEDYGTPLLPLPQSIALYETLCASVKPARVAGVALNTHGLDDVAARRALDDARAATGLPCGDVVRDGPEELYAAMAAAFAHKTRALGAARA